MLRDRKGTSAIEYGLIAGLIAVAMIAGMQRVAGPSNSLWSQIGSQFEGATNRP